MYEIFRYIEKTNDLTSSEVAKKLYISEAEYNMLIQNELLLSKLHITMLKEVFKLNLSTKIKLHKKYKSQKRKRGNGACLDTFKYNSSVTESLLYAYNFMTKPKSNEISRIQLIKDFCDIMISNTEDMKYNKQLLLMACNKNNPIKEDNFNQSSKYLTIENTTTICNAETIFINIEDSTYLAGRHNGKLIAEKILDEITNIDNKIIIYISDNIEGCDMLFVKGFFDTICGKGSNIARNFKNKNIIIKGNEQFINDFYSKLYK